MASIVLTQKGQLSVEFVLILVVILLYVATLIQPNIVTFESISKETFGLGYTSLAANKLVNAIDLVQMSGKDTVQTITMFLPEHGSIKCMDNIAGIPQIDQNSIKFVYLLNQQLAENGREPIAPPEGYCPPTFAGGDDYTCTKKIKPQSGAGILCSTGFTGTGFPGTIGVPGPSLLKVKISKTSADPVVPVTIEILP